MRQYGLTKAFYPTAALLLLGLAAASPISANSVIVGGYVPEINTLSVVASRGPNDSRPDGRFAVAEVEINNNLPVYELVLDFSDPVGLGQPVSEVRLEPMGGILGQGLAEPSLENLPQSGLSGRFVWSPGPANDRHPGIQGPHPGQVCARIPIHACHGGHDAGFLLTGLHFGHDGVRAGFQMAL